MVITSNLMAMNAQRQYKMINTSMRKSTEKLSSGYRINRAADDAAGLSISEKLRYQIRGLNKGAENIQDGISLCQVADGALAEVDSLLHRANELAVKSANGTNTDVDRSYLQQEAEQITREIDRIGKTTTFNEIHIFDVEEIEKQVGKITKMVSSPSAEAGRLAEGYQVGSKWYPSASIDFSAVKAKDIPRLKDAYFSFNCSAACDEAFKFTLINDGRPSFFDPKTAGSGATHQIYVDISNCKNGNDVADAIFNAAKLFTPPAIDSATSSVATTVGGTAVSHSNVLTKSGSVLYLIGTGRGYSATEETAKNVFKGDSYYGQADCSSLTEVLTPEPIYTIPIQCSSATDDREEVKTRAMNAEYIGISPLDISTQSGANESIGKIKKAFEYIAELRSDLGSQQNRLEHTYNTNLNTSENTQAAESTIRDTDMAKEMVANSIQNILSQASVSMMAQANHANQMVLNLLQ